MLSGAARSGWCHVVVVKIRAMSKTGRIDFETQDVAMPSLDQPLLRQWIVKVAASYGLTVRRLLYVFMSDEEILKANNQALGHDYYTDIITFDYSRDGFISGEMQISLDTVASNAELLGVPFSRELLRVVIHGVLHLCGINDKGDGERAIMEAAENRALQLYDKLTATKSREV